MVRTSTLVAPQLHRSRSNTRKMGRGAGKKSRPGTRGTARARAPSNLHTHTPPNEEGTQMRGRRHRSGGSERDRGALAVERACFLGPLHHVMWSLPVVAVAVVGGAELPDPELVPALL